MNKKLVRLQQTLQKSLTWNRSQGVGIEETKPKGILILKSNK
jgi:hypothetical protein